MKRFICSMAITVLFSAFIMAQSGTGEWQTYVSPKDEFSIKVPQKLEEHFDVLKDDKEKPISFVGTYRTNSEGVYYHIFSDEILPEKRGTTFPLAQLKRFITENKSAGQPVTIAGFEGLKYVFRDQEGFSHRIILIETQKRSYIFHAIEENETGSKAERFIGSIKFKNISTAQAPKKPTKKSAREKEAPLLVPTISVPNPDLPISQMVTGAGSGSGSGDDGAGTGRRQGTESDIPGQNIQSSGQTTALQILSKTKPNYTDLARLYNITGTVTLRVTFLANSNIGNIAVIKKLPLGLTENATRVARQIKFTPPMKNGVAYTVSKQVQYNFILY